MPDELQLGRVPCRRQSPYLPIGIEILAGVTTGCSSAAVGRCQALCIGTRRDAIASSTTRSSHSDSAARRRQALPAVSFMPIAADE